jgi:hypothetical protein
MPPKRNSRSSQQTPSNKDTIDRVVSHFNQSKGKLAHSMFTVFGNTFDKEGFRHFRQHYEEFKYPPSESDETKTEKQLRENTERAIDDTLRREDQQVVTRLLNAYFQGDQSRQPKKRKLRLNVCDGNICDKVLFDISNISNRKEANNVYDSFYRIKDGKYCNSDLTDDPNNNINLGRGLLFSNNKQQISDEVWNIIRLFYQGVRDQNTDVQERKRWAAKVTNVERIFQSMNEYLTLLKTLVNETLLIPGKKATSLAFIDEFSKNLGELEIAVKQDKVLPMIIPVFVPFTAVTKEEGRYPIPNTVFTSSNMNYYTLWVPGYIKKNEKYVIQGDFPAFKIWHTPTLNNFTQGGYDYKLELYRLHTIINGFPGPISSNGKFDDPVLIQEADLINPFWRQRDAVNIQLDTRLAASPSTSVSSMQTSPDVVRVIVHNDIKPFKILLSACDTYHDFDTLDQRTTFFNNNQAKLKEAIRATENTQEMQRIAEGRTFNSLRLETAVVNVFEKSSTLAYLLESRLGTPTLPVAVADILNDDTINFNSKYFVVNLGHSAKANRRLATGIYKNQQSSVANMKMFFEKAFGARYKLIIDRSPVSRSIYGEDMILFTGASLYDGAIKESHKINNDVRAEVHREHGELFNIDYIKVSNTDLQIKYRGNTDPRDFQMNEAQSKRFDNNRTWTQCRPQVVNNFLEEMKQCYGDMPIDFFYDLKRAGDALQVKACYELQKADPSTQYIFITHDKLALLHARLMKLNAIYSEINHTDDSRMLHVFRETAKQETSKEKYNRIYFGVKHAFKCISTFADKEIINHVPKNAVLISIKELRRTDKHIAVFFESLISLLESVKKLTKKIMDFIPLYQRFRLEFESLPNPTANDNTYKRHLNSLETFYINLKEEFKKKAITELFTYDECIQIREYCDDVTFKSKISNLINDKRQWTEFSGFIGAHAIPQIAVLLDADVTNALDKPGINHSLKTKIKLFIRGKLQSISLKAVTEAVYRLFKRAKRPGQQGGTLLSFETRMTLVSDILLLEEAYDDHRELIMLLYDIIKQEDVLGQRLSELIDQSEEQLTQLYDSKYSPEKMMYDYEKEDFEDLLSSAQPSKRQTKKPVSVEQ